MPSAFVLDTNVFMSALLFKNSNPTVAYEKARKIGKLVVSDATLKEFAEVLFRPKFDKYISLSMRNLLHIEFSEIFSEVKIKESITACRDPKDDKFLELAITANASCIISGDEDLLILNPFRTIPILTPIQFIDTF